MTREEAIQSLSMLRIFDAPDLNEAVKMAVSAIRSQQTTAKMDRSRWDGCGWCRRFQGKFDETKADRYCKLCGRPLTGEAWAELERRINNGSVLHPQVEIDCGGKIYRRKPEEGSYGTDEPF